MAPETANIKKIYFKAYKSLFLMENAIKNLKEHPPTDFKITILGKVAQFYLEKNIKVLKNTDSIKVYWSELLGKPHNFGSFVNSEIGNVFIVGTLAPTFLREINGKILGTLSSASYSILMGMGASTVQATTLLEMLDSDNYLMIFRGFENELENYQRILNGKKKI